MLLAAECQRTRREEADLRGTVPCADMRCRGNRTRKIEHEHPEADEHGEQPRADAFQFRRQQQRTTEREHRARDIRELGAHADAGGHGLPLHGEVGEDDADHA
jgi:hypothetical protein